MSIHDGTEYWTTAQAASHGQLPEGDPASDWGPDKGMPAHLTILYQIVCRRKGPAAGPEEKSALITDGRWANAVASHLQSVNGNLCDYFIERVPAVKSANGEFRLLFAVKDNRLLHI